MPNESERATDPSAGDDGEWIGTPERLEKIDRVVAERRSGMIVVEDVYDPHNAAAVFRSADAFGFTQVALVFVEQEPFDPYREGGAVATAANRWLDFRVFRSTEECLHELRRDGYESWGTVIGDDAVSLYEADFTAHPKPAIWLGNEHAGLSEAVIAGVDRHLTIPMLGMVQSFNLSVTASIIAFEIERQRRVHGIDAFRIPPGERSELAEEFRARSGPKRLRRLTRLSDRRRRRGADS